MGGGRVPPRVCGCEGGGGPSSLSPSPVHPGGLPPFHPGDKGMGKTRKGIGQDEWTCRCHWKESQPEIHGKTDGPEKPIDQVEIPSPGRRCCQGARQKQQGQSIPSRPPSNRKPAPGRAYCQEYTPGRKEA
eukprot:scaffold131_cov335-Pavlova_lutheri.AAC.36